MQLLQFLAGRLNLNCEEEEEEALTVFIQPNTRTVVIFLPPNDVSTYIIQ
jgi:hypothetical protein